MWRGEDGERGTSKSTCRSKHMESSWWGDGGPADLKKTKGQGNAHLCATGMSVRNGKQTLALTELQQQRLQLCGK